MKPSQKAIDYAIDAARKSPCMKSKRGVVIVGADGAIIGAWNSLPKPFRCDGSAECRRDCSKRCVHAEEQALLLALGARLIKPLDVVHIKVEPDLSETAKKVDLETMRALNRAAGLKADAVAPPIPLVPVPSGPPSCVECAKLMLNVGVAHVWLLHDDGWRRYDALEFYRLTLKTLGLKED